jgi:hypothetical protein
MSGPSNSLKFLASNLVLNADLAVKLINYQKALFALLKKISQQVMHVHDSNKLARCRDG